jgi:LuxR family maltose regulon positive regulatory protein
MIRTAEQVTRDFHSSPPDLDALALYQISLWIAQSDFQAITHWEQQHGSAWQSQIGRLRDTFPLILARARIARYYRQHDVSALSEARALIQPGLDQAQASGLIYNLARLLILDALALYAQGEPASAIKALKRALALAEPENYVRSFLDLDKPMEEFLLWGLENGSLSEPHLCAYVTKLLSHFALAYPVELVQPAGGELIESLTRRELEILQLIAKGLSNREIGERLFLSLNTVKGHNQNIFDKLQVHRRTEAVERARQLGLL